MEEKYQPSLESIKFIAFIRAAGVEDNANAEIHYRLADKYFGKDQQVLIEAFRGSAKSTLMEWFIIYIAALGDLPGFGKVEFIAFVGDSSENGVRNTFRNIAGKIDRSKFLQQFITIQRKTDAEMELVNSAGVELNLKGYGAATNIRGVRYKGARPDIVILDDITTNEAATSETIQNTINNNFYKSVIPALHPTRYKIFFIGTPISERDIIHQLSSNPKWAVHKFPICEKFPCSKEEFKGNWSDRFPYEAVLSKYEMYLASGKAQDFFQEYMIELTDLSTLLVDEEDIQWMDPSSIAKNKSNYNFYISTDFATSTKKSADFSTIGVWAINNNNDWMLVDGQCLRQTMQENLDDLFRYVQKWNPLSVGIESSGQQGGFLSIIQEMMAKRNVWFTLAKKPGSKEPGIRPIKDKMHRFVTGVQPKFKQNKIWFPKPDLLKGTNTRLLGMVEEMLAELSRFTLAGGVTALKHDDCCTPDTMVTMADWSMKRLDEVKVGDYIMTFDIDSVKQQVEHVIMTGVKEVATYMFSDGSEVSMTDNHPVLTTNGYVPAELLNKEDKVIICKQNLMDTNGQRKELGTTKAQLTSLMGKENGYTNMCGVRRMESNQKGVIYTIETVTKIITYLKTLSASKQVNTQNIMGFKEIWKNRRGTSKGLGHLLTNGISPKKEGLGLRKILRRIEKKCLSSMKKNVDGAERVLQLDSLTGLPIAIVSANFKQYKQMLLDRKSMSVSGVELSSNGTERKQDALKNVATTSYLGRKDRRLSPTFNLEVANTHNFIANGVVVHNCLDLLNQLSEMETFAPSIETKVSAEDGWINDDGDIWWKEIKDGDDYGGSTVF